MSDYSSNSSGRGPRGNSSRRRRGGKRRPQQDEPYDSREPSYSREPRGPKVVPPTGFQKFLATITFGLLGKQAPVSKAYANGAPQPIRTPRETPAMPTGANERDRDRGERGERTRDRDREPRREKREPRQAPVSAEVTGERLYVGNLSYDAAESDLSELFSGSGQVKNAEVVVNSRTQRSKGFAFVTMMTIEDAKKAVAELNGKDFMGRPLVVGGAKPLAPREDRDHHHDRGHDQGDDHGHSHEEHQDSSESAPPSGTAEERQNMAV